MDKNKAKKKADSIFNSKPNGREKQYEDSIFWGVAKPYAYLKDCQKAGIVIKKSGFLRVVHFIISRK